MKGLSYILTGKPITKSVWIRYLKGMKMSLAHEQKSELINELIAGLNETEKIVYLTLYFNEYRDRRLLELCGLKSTDWQKDMGD